MTCFVGGLLPSAGYGQISLGQFSSAGPAPTLNPKVTLPSQAVTSTRPVHV